MYGGRSDDLEYMQEVLKTAERLGDKAYIQRLKNQIEEIKRRQSGAQTPLPTLATSKKIAKKEEPLKTSEAKNVGKLGDRCTPIVNRGAPGSCESGTVCWSGVNRCCNRDTSGEFYNCGEAGISAITSSPTTITPTTITPTTITPMTITPTTITSTPIPTESDKKAISDYFDLKMSILKNIQELHKLKIQKDKLLNVIGYTPQLVFHNKQTAMDDCIRDESGKVLQC
jgi:hypothetical protein